MSSASPEQSTALMARRQQLSDAVLTGFETTGWRWTERQLYEGVRGIFTDAPMTGGGVAEVREKLVRTFGEAQVIPHDGALLPLCRRFCEELGRRMAGSSISTYTEDRTILQDPLLETELQGITESKDLFPISYAPRDERWFHSTTKHCRALMIVNASILAPTELNTVLWVAGQAFMRVLQERQRQNDIVAQSEYHGTQFEDEHVLQQQKEELAQPKRAAHLQNLARLPAEVRMEIYSHIAKDFSRGWKVDSNREYLACCRDAILKMISYIEFVPKYTTTSAGDVHREWFRYSNLEELNAALGGEVEEALAKTLYTEYKVNTRSQVIPNRLAVPRTIADRTPHIRHLNLVVKMATPYFTTTYYPSALYRIQDSVLNLKSVFPDLRTLEFTVQDEILSHQNLTIVPKLRVGETTKCAEIAKLVEGLIPLNVKEKWVRYKTSSGMHDYEDRVLASPDKTMVDTDSFVEAMIISEGLALEVTLVESGVGSVWEGIEERTFFDEW